MIFQKIWNFLAKIPEKALVSLLVVNFILVIIYGGFLRFYNYDDFVVTTVALQPMHQFWDTLQSEPHPPGFYLLIKFVSQYLPPPTQLKITLTISSYLILIGSILFASKNQLIKKYDLKLGLLIFFSSFGLLELTNYVKQDIITFPLFFLYLLFLLSKVAIKKLATKEWLVLHLGLFPIFFLGYLYYAQALALLIVFATYRIYLDKHQLKKIITFFVLQIFLILSYGLLFGFNQLHTNLTRFGWVARQNNDLISNLSTFLTGASPHHLITDISILGFLLLVFSAVSSEFKKKNAFQSLFLLLALSILLFTYGGNLFSQIRYSILFFLFISVVAGWGLTKIRQKWVHALAILLVFSLRATLFIKGHEVLKTSFTNFLHTLDEIADESRSQVGLISSAPSAPQYLKLQFFRDKSNIIPLNVSHVELYKQDTFTQQDLLYLDYEINISKDEVRNNLLSTGLDRFIYIFLDDDSYHDPKKAVPNVLIENCKLGKITPIQSSNSIIYFYKKCFD